MWWWMAALGAEHGFDTKAVLDTRELGATEVQLTIGPCRGAVCTVDLQRGEQRLALFSFERPADRATYTVQALEGGWSVEVAEAFGLQLDWRTLEGLAPEPTLVVHWIRGYDHLTDGWVLVDPALKELWRSESAMPRDVAVTSVELVDVAGKPTWVQWATLPRFTQSDSHEVVRFEGFRLAKGTLQPLAEVPLYAVVALTETSPEPAFAARDGEACLAGFAVLATDDLPKLKPGLTVVARVTPNAAQAEGWLSAAKACRADAYVKRAR